MDSAAKTVLGLIVVVAMMFVAPRSSFADVQWIDLALEDGTSVRAAFGSVEGRRSPAIVFNHGTGVRHFGHEGSVRRGDMDVTGYVEALNAMGYAAIAPVRTHLKDTAYYEKGGTVGSTDDWIAVVEHGLSVSRAARACLEASPGVDADRIAIMGFSEGGNVTLWSAIRNGGYRVVVLLAPATLREAKPFSLTRAASKGNLSSVGVPVFLAVGREDLPPVRNLATGKLIPNLEATKIPFVHRTDYPGGHEWFYKPRDMLLDDLRDFLGKYLR